MAWSVRGTSSCEMPSSPIWAEKTAASFTRARSSMEGALEGSGSKRVGQLRGLRQLRPWLEIQSLRAKAQEDWVWPGSDQR